MTELELKDFFDNYVYQTIFFRTKKIYELTNNLDLYLLKALRSDFRRHYLKKALQLVKDFENGVSGEYGHEYFLGVDFIRIYNSERLNKIDVTNERLDVIVSLLSEKDCDLAETVFEGMADFLYEIDLLIRYKESGEIRESGEIHEPDENELIDFSESNYTSKIIFLEKLGIIEYLTSKSPFNTSINSMANALSGVTGIKTTTIQPMLNAMLSNGVSSKNNPLNSKKTVNVVENKLTNIGYSIK